MNTKKRQINFASLGLGMPYVPSSKGKSLNVDTPDSMGAEVTQALRTLKRKIGDVDEYVCQRLGYNNLNELYQALSAEQIDVVALNIYNIEEKNQGIIIADQTGIGKGRCAAAMVRYGCRKGLQPIFITEKPNLFSDLYRDMVAIGSGSLKPYIVNARESKTSVKDEDGVVVYEALIKAEQDKIMNKGSLPKSYNYVMLTYSQISDAGFSKKIEFLNTLAINNNLILDEAHNASGLSNTGLTLQAMVIASAGVTYLSATFAKRPDNMALYAAKTCMQEASLSSEGLTNAIIRGGVALQEVISSQLVGQGQMVRRERTYEGIEVNYINLTNRKAEDCAIADNITEIMRDIIHFQKEHIVPEIAQLDKIAKSGQVQVEMRKGTKDAGVDSTPYFSKVFQVINQMLFAVKADAVADRAIERLKEGKKAVIAFSSTMGSFLESLEDEEAQPVSDGSIINADFATVLRKGLAGTLRYTITNPDGQKKYESFNPSEFSDSAYSEYQSINERINSISSGLVISPIDLIKQKIEKAGYKVAEVTGRKYELILDYKDVIVSDSTPVNLSSKLKKIMPSFQQSIIKSSIQEYASQVSFLNEQVEALPKLYHYENLYKSLKNKDRLTSIDEATIAHLHFFMGNSDWYISEYDGDDTLYGYSVINGDLELAEYGYISLSSLLSVTGKFNTRVELDFYWKPKSMNKVLSAQNEGLAGLGKQTEETKRILFGTLVNRKRENTNDAFRRFNDNEVDVLMINQSGSTGASAHAVPTKKVPVSEVKQRVMIVLQAELDINTEVQKRGRINRTGQILLPIYDYLTSDIPAEKRFMMMLQKKLKSLDANTSANQKNSEALLKSEDFLNKYGDKVVVQFLMENALLNESLGDPLKLNSSEEDSGKSKSGNYENAAHRVSGRVAVLPTADQEKFYTAILERYQDYVKILIEEDKYDLEMEVQNLKAEIKTKRLAKGGLGGVSPFGDNTYMERCEVNVLRKPLSVLELEKNLTEQIGDSNPKKISDDTLALAKTTIERQAREETAEIVADFKFKRENITKEKIYLKLTDKQAQDSYEMTRKSLLLEAEQESIKRLQSKYNQEFSFISKFITFFTIGRRLNYPDDYLIQSTSDSTFAVSLGVKYDLRKEKPFSPGNLSLRIAISSSKRSISFGSISGENAQRILAIIGASTSLPSSFSLERLKVEWSNAISENTKARNIRYILTGNLLQAFADELPKGRLIQFTTKDGKERKGVLLPESYNKKLAEGGSDMMNVTVPISKTLPIIKGLTGQQSITCSGKLSIQRWQSGGYRLVVPAARQMGGSIYLDEDLLEVVEDSIFNKSSDKMFAIINEDDIEEVVTILQKNHAISVVVSMDKFKMIEHLFVEEPEDELSNYVAPVKIQAPIVAEVTTPANNIRITQLKYKYRLRLQLVELELNQLRKQTA